MNRFLLRDSRGDFLCFFPLGRCEEVSRGKPLHRNRLIEPGLHVPARPVSGMWKQRVNAGDRLLRILFVGLIFRFTVFLRDRQDAHGRVGFEGIGRLGVEHADAQIGVVTAIH